MSSADHPDGPIIHGRCACRWCAEKRALLFCGRDLAVAGENVPITTLMLAERVLENAKSGKHDIRLARDVLEFRQQKPTIRRKSLFEQERAAVRAAENAKRAKRREHQKQAEAQRANAERNILIGG